MQKTIFKFLSILMVLVLMVSCGGVPSPSPTAPGFASTQTAQVVSLQNTIVAGQDAVATLTEIAIRRALRPTLTHTPYRTPTPILPSSTPSPTPIPPTETPTPLPPTPVPTSIPCNWALMVKDVRVQQGASFNPSEYFTKTWRIENIGACSWNRAYAIIYDKGDQMGGTDLKWLNANVDPGQMLDVSLRLVAPAQLGQYTGYWWLRTEMGDPFGVGPGASTPISVTINVVEPVEIDYEFINDLSNAAWLSGSSSPPCVGSDLSSGDYDFGSLGSQCPNGFAGWSRNPQLENGNTENENALIVSPNSIDGGYISGRFPAFQVQAGDHFRTVLGCMYGAYGCNVMFQLNYSADGGPVQNLKTWTEFYDGKITPVDIDLSFLVGRSVEFVLMTMDNGNSMGDWAFWLHPRIVD